MFITRDEYHTLRKRFPEFTAERFPQLSVFSIVGQDMTQNETIEAIDTLAGVYVGWTPETESIYHELIGHLAEMTFGRQFRTACWYWCEDEVEMDERVDELKQNGHTNIKYTYAFDGFFVYLTVSNIAYTSKG